MAWVIANMAPLMFGALVLFLLFGYPVAFALAANGIVFGLLGIELGLLHPALFQALPERIFGIMANDTLLAIPFFTFMGLILERSGMAEDLLDTIGQLFGPMRGGLAYAVIFVGALLAATTGVVAASVISMGLISLPIMLVESFYLLLGYTDVLMLQQFRSSEEVGIYFAVVKTLALVSFVHYAMSATTAHRFAEYNALGDKDRLSAYVAHAISWTFWPSLLATIALLAFGKPLLWLFGPKFVDGYSIMFVAAIGLVVRSAIGPVERLLNMLGHQSICATAYAVSFLMNVGLCIALVPRYGGMGAAASTSLSLTFETILLFVVVRSRLGLHVLAFGKARPTP